jgi:hypothetical protein
MTFVAAYLMYSRGLDCDDALALALIRKARPSISSSGVQVAVGDVSEVLIEETPSHLHHALSQILLQSQSQPSLRSLLPPPPPLSKPSPMAEFDVINGMVKG